MSHTVNALVVWISDNLTARKVGRVSEKIYYVLVLSRNIKKLPLQLTTI